MEEAKSMQTTNTGKIIDERIQINKNKKNMSEAFYLIVTQPESSLTFIVRYVLFNGEDGLSGHMGAWILDKQQKIDLIFYSHYSQETLSITEDRTALKIGNCSINRDQLSGMLEANGHKISWTLSRNKTNTLGVDRFPLLLVKMDGTGFQSPDCKGSVTGEIQVDAITYRFDNYPASTGHYFGVKKKLSWMWTNCIQFNEDKEALFEGISINRFERMPAIAFFSLYWNGRFYNFNGISKSLMRYRQTVANLEEWQFEFTESGYVFAVSIHANRQDMIVHTHPINEQTSLYTAISYCADMTIQIFQNKQLIQKLNAKQSASFEFTRSKPFIEVKRSYQQTPNTESYDNDNKKSI